jgi:hypothetical protein
MEQGRCETGNHVIVPHSNAIKPYLTEENMMTRLMYAGEHIDVDTGYYNDPYRTIHVDEKWFVISEVMLHMYLVPGEHPPERSCPHKSHIIKVMFLAAIAKPRYNADGECTFDGKIGMWPFIERVAAQRNSSNRPAGTIETKCVTVTKQVYREYMIEKVIPAIKEKWPNQQELKDGLIVQQDGAKTHHRDEDPAWAAAARNDSRVGGCCITLSTQPANSPDTNLCDLSFFRALQSNQWNHGYAATVDGLIEQVLTAFEEFDPRSLEFGFLTHQCCLNKILESRGRNTYKIPHIGKKSLLAKGILPHRIKVSTASMVVAREFMPELVEN